MLTIDRAIANGLMKRCRTIGPCEKQCLILLGPEYTGEQKQGDRSHQLRSWGRRSKFQEGKPRNSCVLSCRLGDSKNWEKFLKTLGFFFKAALKVNFSSWKCGSSYFQFLKCFFVWFKPSDDLSRLFTWLNFILTCSFKCVKWRLVLEVCPRIFPANNICAAL